MTHRISPAVAGLALACAASGPPDVALAGQTPPSPATAQKEPPMDLVGDAVRAAGREAMLQTLPTASVVFQGTLVSVGDPPGFWSGYQIAYQTLTYEIQTVWKGSLQGPRITVHQRIVASSPVARPDSPALRDEFTVVGQSYVVLLGPPQGGLQVAASDGFGPQRATPELVASVEAALR